jgi:hypothetical protein
MFEGRDLLAVRDDVLEAALNVRATWLHFNLLTAEDGSAVVTFTSGPSAGQGSSAPPAVNVSAERRPVVIEGD